MLLLKNKILVVENYDVLYRKKFFFIKKWNEALIYDRMAKDFPLSLSRSIMTL